MGLRNSSNSTKFNSGNTEFDANRFNAKGPNDKSSKKTVRIDAGAHAGDFFDDLFRRLLSPSVWMLGGYIAAGVCLTIGVHAYSRLLIPALAGSLPTPFDFLAGACLSVVLGVGIQLIEISPRLDEYFPGMADRLAVKLKLSPVAQPTPNQNSPSLLPKMNDRAKQASEKAFKDMEGASAIAYGIEALGALWAFPLIVKGALNIPALIGAIVAVAGFELCLKFARWMKEIRLTARESRHYREHKRRLNAEAAQDLNK